MLLRKPSVLRTLAFMVLAGCLAVGLTLAVAGEDKAATSERPWLGVVLTEVNDEPVRVGGVVEGGPAEAAGIQKGDRILSIDGQPVSRASDVVRAVRESEVGANVTIEVEGEDGTRRSHSAVLAGRAARSYAFSFNGKDYDFDLGDLQESLAELREHFGEEWQSFNWNEQGAARGYLGVGLIQPSDDLRKTLGALEGEGVLIDTIADESPAADAGLRAGDVVISLDGEKIGSTGELARLVRSREPGTSVSLGIIRERAPLTLDATLGESKDRIFMFRGAGEGEGEGPQGFRFGPHELRFFRGEVGEGLDLDALHEAIEGALAPLENLEIEVHEDDEGGDVKREIQIGPRIGSVDA